MNDVVGMVYFIGDVWFNDSYYRIGFCWNIY